MNKSVCKNYSNTKKVKMIKPSLKLRQDSFKNFKIQLKLDL